MGPPVERVETMHAGARQLTFLTFRCDLHARMLFRIAPDAEPELVPLGARAFDLLCLFLNRPGVLITKSEIFASVWPDIAVEDSNLTVQMSALRRVLDAGRDGPSCIQTVPGRGYRFLPEVHVAPTPASPDPIPRDAAPETPQQAPPDSPPAPPPTETVSPSSSRAAPGPATGETASPDRVAAVPGQDTAPQSMEDRTPPPAANTAALTRPRPPRWALPAAALAVVLIIALVAAGGVRRSEAPDPVVPKLMSVATRPFTMAGGGPADTGLTSTLSAAIGSGLVGIEASTVIDASAADLAGLALDAPATRVGRALHTRYVLDGTILRGPPMQVTARLTDSATGVVVWSDSYDAGRAEPQTLTELALRITASVRRTMLQLETARLETRPQDLLSPSEMLVMATSAYGGNDPITPDASERAARLLERVVAADPKQINAIFILTTEVLRPLAQHRDVPGREARLRHAEDLVALARKHAPGAQNTLTLQGLILTLRGHCDAAEPLWAELLQQYPGVQTNLYKLEMGYCLRLRGHLDEAITLLKGAIEPGGNNVVGLNLELGAALYAAGRDTDAVPALRFAKERAPVVVPRLRLYLAAAEARAGHDAAAARERDEMLAIDPGLTLRRFLAAPFPNEPSDQTLRLAKGLVLAGWPNAGDLPSEPADPPPLPGAPPRAITSANPGEAATR